MTNAELTELEAVLAKSQEECFCRFACECGCLAARRNLENVLPSFAPALLAAARREASAREQALEDAAKLIEGYETDQAFVGVTRHGKTLAAAIRALKGAKP